MTPDRNRPGARRHRAGVRPRRALRGRRENIGCRAATNRNRSRAPATRPKAIGGGLSKSWSPEKTLQPDILSHHRACDIQPERCAPCSEQGRFRPGEISGVGAGAGSAGLLRPTGLIGDFSDRRKCRGDAVIDLSGLGRGKAEGSAGGDGFGRGRHGQAGLLIEVTNTIRSIASFSLSLGDCYDNRHDNRGKASARSL